MDGFLSLQIRDAFLLYIFFLLSSKDRLSGPAHGFLPSLNPFHPPFGRRNPSVIRVCRPEVVERLKKSPTLRLSLEVTRNQNLFPPPERLFFLRPSPSLLLPVGSVFDFFFPFPCLHSVVDVACGKRSAEEITEPRIPFAICG